MYFLELSCYTVCNRGANCVRACPHWQTLTGKPAGHNSLAMIGCFMSRSIIKPTHRSVFCLLNICLQIKTLQMRQAYCMKTTGRLSSDCFAGQSAELRSWTAERSRHCIRVVMSIADMIHITALYVLSYSHYSIICTKLFTLQHYIVLSYSHYSIICTKIWHKNWTAYILSLLTLLTPKYTVANHLIFWYIRWSYQTTLKDYSYLKSLFVCKLAVPAHSFVYI